MSHQGNDAYIEAMADRFHDGDEEEKQKTIDDLREEGFVAEAAALARAMDEECQALIDEEE